MKMKNNPVEWIGCGIATILTAIQTEHVFQIISLVLTCIATLVTLAFTIWKWWKNAKADGKIDKDELEELGNIVTDGAKEIKESLKKEESEKSEGE